MFESIDRWFLGAMYAGGSSTSWIACVAFVTFLGSGWMLFGLLPCFFLRRWRFLSAALLLTLAATSGVVASIKALVGRVRPCHAFGWMGRIPIELPCDPSFPSGHAAGSFAFAAFIGASHRRAGLLLAGLATLVALSRIALGVHYPSDVAVGALLGGLLGRLGARAAFTFAARARETSPAVGLADADPEAVGQ